jgi:hypothetical protein
MFESILAGTVLAVCVVLLLRPLLPEHQRWKLDAFARRSWQRLRALPSRLHRVELRRKPSVEREARDAIERARRSSMKKEPGGRQPSDRLH